MDKYIRFGDAINAIKELPDSPNGFSDTYDKARIIAELEEVSAADVVVVVRCNDCIYWGRKQISAEGLAKCLTGESGIRYRKSTDFCSKGHRRMEADHEYS